MSEWSGEFDSQAIRNYWQKFYKDNFSIQPTLSKLEIPEPRECFSWHIVTLEEVTEQMLYDKCKGLFPCWKWTDKNESLNDVLKLDRTSKGTHVALFRNRQEADEELKNLSADRLEEKGIIGNTLKQRLIMELDYFLRTGRHLDIDNATLCVGSRYSDGVVPYVRFRDDRMRVDRGRSRRSRWALALSSAVSLFLIF